MCGWYFRSIRAKQFIPEATENTKRMSLDTKLIFILFVVQNPRLDVMGPKESDLNCEWIQIISAPIWIPFGVTPSQETEGPDPYLTVKSLAVRIWMGRPLLKTGSKSCNKDININNINKDI